MNFHYYHQAGAAEAEVHCQKEAAGAEAEEVHCQKAAGAAGAAAGGVEDDAIGPCLRRSLIIAWTRFARAPMPLFFFAPSGRTLSSSRGRTGLSSLSALCSCGSRGTARRGLSLFFRLNSFRLGPWPLFCERFREMLPDPPRPLVRWITERVPSADDAWG